MKYPDGTDIALGDIVQIDVQWRGRVVASMDTGRYLPGYPEAEWRYLADGILVESDFGGLIHYTAIATDQLTLLRRQAEPSTPMPDEPNCC